jgi:uncharacterized cupredoxin-like copper-binding protein
MRTGTAVTLTLVLSACLGDGDEGSASPPPSVRIVELSMDGMRFTPERVEVRLHDTVRFMVSNPEDIPHEVFIGSEAEQLVHRAAHASIAPQEQADVPHYGYGTYIPAWGTGQFEYRFDASDEVMIGCHLPGHWEAGMKALIVVTSPSPSP